MDETPKVETGTPEQAAGAGTPAGAKPGRAASPRRRTIIITAVVLAVIVALVLPVVSTLQPGYYERYPSMRARMAGWRTSTHALFSCADCHVDPGVGGFTTFWLKSIPAFYSQLIFGPTSTNLLSAPSRAACQKCHTTYRQISPSGDLLIPHRAHVEALHIACAVCHKNLVHFPNAAGFNRPEMATCTKCHDGKQAKSECVVCHTQKQVPDNHKQPNWLTIHPTMVTKIDCAKCHGFTPDFCKTCHSQRPASHAGNWKYLHQFAAKLRGQTGCLVCHDQKKFCDKCH